MSRLQPAKLHVELGSGMTHQEPVTPRCYTLTHSDASGELFLTIAQNHNRKQISGLYTRLMRDEVLAEWVEKEGVMVLSVHCHVSGGLVFGTARWRYAIFKHELPLVLEVFRYGDQRLFAVHPELENAPIEVNFHSHRKSYNRLELWGTLFDYRV
jgi:hypothetical protein